MANQEEILNITTDTFIPADAAVAATTVTTNDIYFSVSVANAVKVGYFITDSSQKESRKVTYVDRAGTNGTIESAFSSDLSALALRVIDKEDCKIVSLGIAADQSTDTEIDGKTLTSGSSVNYSTTPNKSDTGTRYIKPKYVEGATTGACTAVIERFGN